MEGSWDDGFLVDKGREVQSADDEFRKSSGEEESTFSVLGP